MFGAQDARGSVARPELLQNQLAPCCEKAAVPSGGSALLSEALARMQANFTAGLSKPFVETLLGDTTTMPANYHLRNTPCGCKSCSLLDTIAKRVRDQFVATLVSSPGSPCPPPSCDCQSWHLASFAHSRGRQKQSLTVYGLADMNRTSTISG